MGITSPFHITQRQREIVEAVIKYKSYSEAAKNLGITIGAIRQAFFRLRMKDADAVSLHKQIATWQRELGPKKRYLTT